MPKSSLGDFKCLKEVRAKIGSTEAAGNGPHASLLRGSACFENTAEGQQCCNSLTRAFKAQRITQRSLLPGVYASAPGVTIWTHSRSASCGCSCSHKQPRVRLCTGAFTMSSNVQQALAIWWWSARVHETQIVRQQAFSAHSVPLPADPTSTGPHRTSGQMDTAQPRIAATRCDTVPPQRNSHPSTVSTPLTNRPSCCCPAGTL